MLKTLLLIFIFVTAGCVQNNMDLDRNSELRIESEVKQAFKALAVSARSLNIDNYLGFFDREKFTSLNDNGSVFHSFSEFEKSYRQQIPFLKKYNSLEFTNVKITVLNNSTAILVNEYAAEVVLQSGDTVSAGGAGSQVWSKASGSWLLVNVSGSAKANN